MGHIYLTKMPLSATTIDEKRRKCRFATHNKGLTLFRRYSQGACQFECQIKMAIEKCGCVPWDYPQLAEANLTEVCEGWGRHCFESDLRNDAKRLKFCRHCLPDCSITRYISSIY